MNINKFLSSVKLLPSKSNPTHRRRVLVVANPDSKSTLGMQVKKMLIRLGDRTTVVKDAKAALQEVQNNEFDVVLVDLNLMPSETSFVGLLRNYAPVVAYGMPDYRLMRAVTKGANFLYANGTIRLDELKLALENAKRPSKVESLVESSKRTAETATRLCRTVEHAVGKGYGKLVAVAQK